MNSINHCIYNIRIIFFAVAVFFCCLLAACSGKQATVREAPDPAGYSGTISREAEEAFTRARVLWRKDANTRLALERCSDPELALDLLDKAIALEPKYSKAYIWRGIVKSEIGQREEAFDDLTAAIRLQPSPEAYAFRGLVSIRAGQGDAARSDLDYSLELAPGQHTAHNYLGVLELGGGDTRAACAAFKQGCARGDCAFIEAARKEKLCP